LPRLWAGAALLGLGALLSLPAADIGRPAGGTTLAKPPVEWPLFRGNPLQTGVAAPDLPDKLEVLWKFDTKDSVEGTAAVVGNTVYVGSYDGFLYALELATGREKWKYKAGPIKAPVSVRGDTVYVGDADGVFHCVEAATGKKRWTFRTDGEIASGANFTRDAVLFGSDDANLYCLAKDGTLKWKLTTGDRVNGSPAVTGERTFVAGCDSSLHVIDTAKGKELKAIELGGPVGATAAVDGDLVYVGTMSNQVLGVDWQKGEVAWTFEPARRALPFYSSAAVTDKLIILGGRDKRLYGLDRKTGHEAWSFLTGGKVDSSPVVVGGRVFVGSLDGKLYVLDLAKGNELTKFDLGGPVSASPAVGSRCLVIGTQKGTVYCFGPK
jgi:outer membrane protein assembly factor BamB